MRCFRICSLFIVHCLVVHVCTASISVRGNEQFCRYWCRTIDHRYYCCPSGKVESWPEYIWRTIIRSSLWMDATHVSPSFEFSWPEIYVRGKETTKRCPPLRTHCPRSYDWYSPPISCYVDEDCDEWEKCCYDVCLEHKTCKRAK